MIYFNSYFIGCQFGELNEFWDENLLLCVQMSHKRLRDLCWWSLQHLMVKAAPFTMSEDVHFVVKIGRYNHFHYNNSIKTTWGGCMTYMRWWFYRKRREKDMEIGKTRHRHDTRWPDSSERHDSLLDDRQDYQCMSG